MALRSGGRAAVAGIDVGSVSCAAAVAVCATGPAFVLQNTSQQDAEQNTRIPTSVADLPQMAAALPKLPQLCRDSDSGESIPSAVAFSPHAPEFVKRLQVQIPIGERFVGDSAQSRAISDPKNAFVSPFSFLGRKVVDSGIRGKKVLENVPEAERLGLNEDAIVDGDSERFSLETTFGGEKRTFPTVAVAAMLLERVAHNIQSGADSLLQQVDLRAAELQAKVDQHEAERRKYEEDKKAEAAARRIKEAADKAAEAAKTEAEKNDKDPESVEDASQVDTPMADAESEHVEGVPAVDAPTLTLDDLQEQPPVRSVLAVPGSLSAEQRSSALTAARAAGYQLFGSISSIRAAALCYGWSKSDDIASDEAHNSTRNVLLVEVGHVHASAAVCSFTFDSMHVDAEVSRDASCGSAAFDHAIFEHARNDFESKNKGTDILGDARARARLLRESRKVKEMLSGLNEAVLSADYLQNDKDCNVAVSRSVMESTPLSQAALTGLTELVRDCLAQSKMKVDRVEVVGGGTRMPAVKRAIEKGASQDGGPAELFYSLDSAHSVAMGAAIAARLAAGAGGGTSGDKLRVAYRVTAYDDSETTVGAVQQPNFSLADAEIASVQKTLNELAESDKIVKERGQACNDLEAYIFATRDRAAALNASGVRDEEKVTDDQLAAARSVLQEAEDWMYDDTPGTGGESATTEELRAKLAELSAEISELAPGLPASLKREAIEREELRQATEAERARAAADKSHESRKLRDPRTNKQKLEAAQTRKEQGNKLFKEHDYDGSLVRYTQAIEALLDTFDLTPEQDQEGKDLRLACHLNAAQACLKIKKYPRAAHNCDDALKIDAENAKALFRRGQARYYLREFEKARTDLEEALKVEPNSRDILRTLAAVKTAIAKEVEKEKAMFGKMFS